MSFHVAVEVVGNEIVVTLVDDAIAESGEATCVAEFVSFDGVEDFGEVGIELEFAIVMRVTEVFDVFCEVAEEEDVRFADFTGDFDLVEFSRVSYRERVLGLRLLHRKYR